MLSLQVASCPIRKMGYQNPFQFMGILWVYHLMGHIVPSILSGIVSITAPSRCHASLSFEQAFTHNWLQNLNGLRVKCLSPVVIFNLKHLVALLTKIGSQLDNGLQLHVLDVWTWDS